MPVGFLSWRHYMNALFCHCRVALTPVFVILPVAEPTREWGPTVLSIVYISKLFLNHRILPNIRHSVHGWHHDYCIYMYNIYIYIYIYICIYRGMVCFSLYIYVYDYNIHLLYYVYPGCISRDEPRFVQDTWWRHPMEIFSALRAICAGNSSVPGEFPAQRPVTRSFDVFFDLRLNKQLSK